MLLKLLNRSNKPNQFTIPIFKITLVAIKARKEIKEQELLPTTQQEISRNNVELELLRNKTLIPEQEIDFDYIFINIWLQI